MGRVGFLPTFSITSVEWMRHGGVVAGLRWWYPCETFFRVLSPGFTRGYFHVLPTGAGKWAELDF